MHAIMNQPLRGNNHDNNNDNQEVENDNDDDGIDQDQDHVLEVTELNEDTATFGQLVVELMQRRAPATATRPDRMIRHIKMDGFGAHREPPWAGSRNIDLFFHAILTFIQIDI